MYPASEAFHQAVANGAHQIALLIFSDAVFTNDDINVTSGIEFNDYFNTEENLTIGTALSNEITFSIFNDTGLLDDYEFGEFSATIGAQTGNDSFSTSAELYVGGPSHWFTAHTGTNRLRMNDVPVSSQPSRPIVTMLIYKGLLYCLLDNGTVSVYSEADGTAVSGVSVNAFMQSQLTKWKGKGICFAPLTSGGNNILKIWSRTNVRTYEFVPLGWFMAERPNVPTVNEIHFTCYDLMQKFEQDMPDDATLGVTYPLSYGGLFAAMCDYACGSGYYRTATFINSNATLESRPEDFDNVTMRDVLGWIAEAACSVARFDRDGYLTMDWLHSTNFEIGENGYSEFNPYWYETKRIDKVCNRASSGEYSNETGSGTETYLIQDNPLLKGVS